MPKRMFLAIPLAQTTLALLAQYGKQLRLSDIRWIPSHNIHITLYFCGALDEELIPELVTVCTDVCKRHAPFSLSFNNITLAPPQDPRRMIWAEYAINDNYRSLATDIKQTIQSFLLRHNQVGIQDEKSLIPHATLARCGPYFKPPLAPLPTIKIPDALVTKVLLMESKLTQEGPLYTIVATLELGNS